MQGTEGRPLSQSILASDLCVPSAFLPTAQPHMERAISRNTRPAGSVSQDKGTRSLAAGALSGPTGDGDVAAAELNHQRPPWQRSRCCPDVCSVQVATSVSYTHPGIWDLFRGHVPAWWLVDNYVDFPLKLNFTNGQNGLVSIYLLSH